MRLLIRVLLATLILPFMVVVGIPALTFIGVERFRALWPPAGADLAAIVVFAGGWFIYAMCAWSFAHEGKGTPAPWDAPTRIVVGGLYKWTRNPMYVGVVIALAGESWWLHSTALWIYTALIAVAFHLRVLMYEEPAMRRLNEADFVAYTSRVKRWGIF